MQYDPKRIPEEFAEVVFVVFQKRKWGHCFFPPLSWRHKIDLVGILDFEGSNVKEMFQKLHFQQLNYKYPLSLQSQMAELSFSLHLFFIVCTVHRFFQEQNALSLK